MLKKTYWLFCDGCGDQFKDTAESIYAIRREARRAGWTYSKCNGDKCQTCAQCEYEEWVDAVRVPLDE